MLRERYAAVAEDPFNLPRKLDPPLPPMSNQLDVIPFEYPLYCEGSKDKAVTVASPTSWILFYRRICRTLVWFCWRDADVHAYFIDSQEVKC